MSDRSRRVTVGAILATVTVGLSLGAYVRREDVFYNLPKSRPAEVWRLLWLGPFIFGGIAARAFIWQNYSGQSRQGSPWREYLLEYPAGSILAAWLVFAGCHSALGLDNWLFYPTSAVAVFLLSLAPGRAWARVRKFADGK